MTAIEPEIPDNAPEIPGPDLPGPDLPGPDLPGPDIDPGHQPEEMPWQDPGGGGEGNPQGYA